MRLSGLAEELRRVVADLLELGQQLDHEAAALDALRVLDLRHRAADDRLVEADLLAGEVDAVVGLDLGRQLRRDAGIGLAAAQHERPDELREPGRLAGVAARLDRARPGVAELLVRPEEPRRGPVEDRPQLGEVVLDRRAGQRQARLGGDAADRLSRARVRVLDVLRLVGDDQAPARLVLGQLDRVGAHRGVRRDEEPVVDAVEPPLGPVIAAYVDARREPLDLALPVAQHGGRAHHERRRRGDRGALQVQGDQHDGLAEAHVVGEDAAESEVDELRHPAQALQLVVAQRPVEPVRLHRRGDVAVLHGEPLAYVLEPADRVDLGHPAVDLELAGDGRPQRLERGDLARTPLEHALQA